MRPTKNTVWYKKDQGPGLVKLVTGNFKVTSTVRARRASAPGEPVSNGYQFAGLIARDPASAKPDAKESYVFNVVGYRGDYLSVETKTTKRDHSDVEGPAWPSADAELRICRKDDVFRVYKRPSSATPTSGVTCPRRSRSGRSPMRSPISSISTGASKRSASPQ
jgi:hypothetical protein